MKTLLPLADGVEEMEAVIVIDTLRRAGFEVISAGLSAGIVEASRGVKLMPDTVWNRINPDDFNMLLLPGGFEGTAALCEHSGVQKALREFDAKGKHIGAICAAALALYKAGTLKGKRFTCYPGVEEKLPADIQPVDESVVVDGHLITSQGPGTAFEFAIRIVAECESSHLAASVRRGLLL